jgi:DNA repair exonuclease SbcCD nuclease subunit
MPDLEQDFKDNLAKLVEMTIAMRVEYLVVAGDLFENNEVKPHMISFVRSQVARLKEHNIKFVGIAGDHDKPLRGESWIRVSNILPVTEEPCFAGIDYFDYSSVSVEELANMIKENREPEKVLWLFLHCQFPQLFSRSEAKKIIDYNHLRLFEHFPNLQGVIAGDIHSGPETRAYGVDKEAYVGYPGSLTSTDISEVANYKHVLYCDGKTLNHVDFPADREMVKIDFRGKEAEDFDITKYIDWAKQQTKRPLFYINWDRESDRHMQKTSELYQYGMVKMQQLPVGATGLTEETTIANRSDTSTGDKIEKALRKCCEDEDDDEVYELALSLLTDDYRESLDKYKAKFEL